MQHISTCIPQVYVHQVQGTRDALNDNLHVEIHRNDKEKEIQRKSKFCECDDNCSPVFNLQEKDFEKRFTHLLCPGMKCKLEHRSCGNNQITSSFRVLVQIQTLTIKQHG